MIDPSLYPPDKLATFYLRQSTAAIVNNVGFSRSQVESLNVLAVICRAYMEKLCRRSLAYAHHANKLPSEMLSQQDVIAALNEMNFSWSLAKDYVDEVAPFQVRHQAPIFPAPVLKRDLGVHPNDSPPRIEDLIKRYIRPTVSAKQGSSLRSATSLKKRAKKNVSILLDEVADENVGMQLADKLELATQIDQPIMSPVSVQIGDFGVHPNDLSPLTEYHIKRLKRPPWSRKRRLSSRRTTNSNKRSKKKNSSAIRDEILGENNGMPLTNGVDMDLLINEVIDEVQASKRSVYHDVIDQVVHQVSDELLQEVPLKLRNIGPDANTVSPKLGPGTPLTQVVPSTSTYVPIVENTQNDEEPTIFSVVNAKLTAAIRDHLKKVRVVEQNGNHMNGFGSKYEERFAQEGEMPRRPSSPRVPPLRLKLPVVNKEPVTSVVDELNLSSSSDEGETSLSSSSDEFWA